MGEASQNSHKQDNASRFMEFIEGQERQQEKLKRRKSRFVSEFRSQLTRVPLQHRVKMTEQEKKSFVLSDTTNRSRLSVSGMERLRRKRTVSEWAQKKNASFQSFAEPN